MIVVVSSVRPAPTDDILRAVAGQRYAITVEEHYREGGLGSLVAETLSVMVQVLYYKWSGGKRIFRMAPLHHHYELSGWKESQVVVRFWIITMMLVLFGLSTLKLR